MRLWSRRWLRVLFCLLVPLGGGVFALSIMVSPLGSGAASARVRGLVSPRGARANTVPVELHASLLGVSPTQPGQLARGTIVPSSEAIALAFANRTVGYALGGRIGSTYPLKTTDGGRTWRVDGPALFLPIADAAAAVGELTVVNQREAYAYGGPGEGSTIDITTDGGVHWWRTSIGQALVGVTRFGTNLWALGLGPGGSTAANPPPLWLYESNDGGRSWSFHTTLPSVHGWEADLRRPSARVAYVLTKAFRKDNPSAGGIVKTIDGGAHWSEVSNPCNTAFSGHTVDWSERLSAPTPTALWLFCGGTPNGGVQTKVLYRSTDGGKRWQLVSSAAPGEHPPPGAIPYLGSLPEPGTTGELVVRANGDATLILLSGDKSTIVGTADGGHTWTRAAPLNVEAGGPERFSAYRHGLVLQTNTGLFAESSGGRWSRIS